LTVADPATVFLFHRGAAALPCVPPSSSHPTIRA
jgi:hypothetical protein